MAPPRMTANPKRPARYRPGKGQDQASESEYETEEEQIVEKPKAKPKPIPAPTSKVTGAFQEVSLNELKAAPVIDEDEFETESEDEAPKKARVGASGPAEEAGEEDDESSSEEESDEEDDSSEESSEEEAPKLLRPTFVRKNQRPDAKAAPETKSEAEIAAEAEARRKDKADALIQEQLERNAALKANEKKAWDDSDNEGIEGRTEAEVDDTDDLDPEAELAAWKLRELKRVKRSREVIELAEKEREEVERRRNLTKEERDAEDAAHLAAQEEDRESKGKAGYMQRYFHKGAFFQDSAYAEEVGLKGRDIMGSKFADQINNREVLPEFMQIRDMAKLGRKGRTKYKDLKNEDTGRWGDFGRPERRMDGGPPGGNMDDGLDERFRPDDDRKGPSGANATAVNGSRRRDSPRRERRRSYSRSKSPPRHRNGHDSRDDDRRRHRSRSRDRKKRSASPGEYRDKRVKVS